MKKQSITKFILSSVRPFYWMLIAQFGVSIIYAADLNLGPYLIKSIIDAAQVKADDTVNKVSFLAFIYILLYLTTASIYRVYDYVCLLFNSRLKKHIGITLMDKLMEHSYNFYQNQFAGALANNTKNVMNSIPVVLEIIVERFFNGIITIIISGCAFWRIHPVFSVSLMIWGVVFVAATYKFSGTAKKLSFKAAYINSNVIGHIVDILGNMFNVRLFNGPNFEKNKLTDEFNKSVKADQQRDWFFLKMFSFQSILVITYQSVCLYYLIQGMKQNTISAGDFVLIIIINIQIVNKFWGLTKYINRFASEIGNIEQSLELIYSSPEIADEVNAKNLVIKKRGGGEIVFDNVKFYHKESHNLFENLTLTIPAGQKVGLVGYSGSGKSTFVNLILRLFDPLKGKILIDGQDISRVSQQSLREAIGLIPQEPYLFHRSVLDNIRYGNFSSNFEKVKSAAEKAHAHVFIEGLPNKYNSLVGEKGVKLSGGQRQRIAIARTILKNPPILILDEATSSLDSITENQIQETITHLMERKTTIVVAHRLSTLLHMDRILVFDKGKIVEDGTHKNLLKLKGLYATLWRKQTHGFLPVKKEDN